LNEPAGLVAKIVVSYAVTQVVAAWSNETIDARNAVESILQCFCHPALLNQSSQLQQTMFATVKLWIDSVPVDKKPRILDGLTREGVRQGRHHDDEKRKAEQGILPTQTGLSRTVVVGGVSQTPSLFPSTIGGISGMAAVSASTAISSRAISGMASTSGMAGASVTTTSPGYRGIYGDNVDGSYDYSHNYHLAQLYATTAFQAQSSYSVTQQRSGPVNAPSYAQGVGNPTPGTETNTSTPGVMRLWPYNMDYYLKRDMDGPRQQSYTTATSQQTQLPYRPDGSTYQSSYATTTYAAATTPYSPTVTLIGNDDSQSTSVRESFQNMTIREVYRQSISLINRMVMELINHIIVNNNFKKKVCISRNRWSEYCYSFIKSLYSTNVFYIASSTT
jgi:hypothetical protein